MKNTIQHFNPESEPFKLCFNCKTFKTRERLISVECTYDGCDDGFVEREYFGDYELADCPTCLGHGAYLVQELSCSQECWDFYNL